MSQALDEPISLQICGEFAGLVPVLEAQPYLDEVFADDRWSLTPPEEWRAPAWKPGVIHLGNRGWPQIPLAQNTYSTLCQVWPDEYPALPPLDLQTPWITWGQPNVKLTQVSIGFTEEWFELKVGLLQLLRQAWTRPHTTLMIPNGRWDTEFVRGGCDWKEAALRIAYSHVFLGCCSAPHVLAVAMGIPVVLVEPSEARRNPIFYPVGMDGPQVTLVRGQDGEATFDARAVRATVERMLEGARR